MMWANNKNGFSIVELLIVVTVVGILATIGVTGYVSSQVKARDVEREADAKAIAQALEQYVLSNGSYPQTISVSLFGNKVSQNIFKSPGETSADSLKTMNDSVFSTPAGAKRTSYIYVPFVNGPSSPVVNVACGTVSVGGVTLPCDAFAVVYLNEQANEWRWVTSRKYPPPESRLVQIRESLAASGI